MTSRDTTMNISPDKVTTLGAIHKGKIFSNWTQNRFSTYFVINERSSDCAEPGPSLAKVAAEPLKMVLIPPCLYRLETVWANETLAAEVCITILTRSNGAAISVVGIALKNPAALICDIVRGEFRGSKPETAQTSFFPTSYPQKDTANIGVTPKSGDVTPL
ncbi:hypothetical protein OGAPHI_002528 [Ogataea philodendri]|uniref:Uncharacterized protein n=1 Tax=Ogataea philodendri TaxID=1378263 RepID=A0A9P8PAU3_9ASCO|nr:uncharacterized protein OGAPHI_002528 [Ogataea philodendri]KAH3668773.1 hypothetical protein OGAPHI_002528 [Ogataea philodendri]